MVNLPNAVSGARLALVPVLLALAWLEKPRAFAVCLLCSLLTDLLDGLLARFLRHTTELGAKLDSWGDFATYLALPLCGWWLRPDALRQEAAWLGAGILFYVAAMGAGFLKFRRLTSYHTFGAKLTALCAGPALLVFFWTGAGWPLRIVMPLLVVVSLEEIAITLALPQWRPDVPSLLHALRIRREAVP